MMGYLYLEDRKSVDEKMAKMHRKFEKMEEHYEKQAAEIQKQLSESNQSDQLKAGKKGIKIYLTSGIEAVLKFPHSIEEFKKQLDKAIESGSDWFVYKGGMVCISQIVFAQEVESEEAEDDDVTDE